MLKKGLLLLLLVFVFSLMFAGVVQAQEGRIAVVYATGGLGDKSFNDSAHEGITRAEEELDIVFDQAEPEAISEYETYLNQFAASGRYDLIIGIGFDQADAMEEVAGRFSDQNFAIVDTVVEESNVASYVYDEKERGFLMGAAAAAMTAREDDSKINADEKKIGVIGGMKIPLIEANIAGYKAGAEYIDPEVEVLHSYVGDWADPAKAKELTISMIEDDVDVIWGAAGRSGLGVISAAEENDVYAMGADSDQEHEAPEHVLSSGVKYVNNTVYLAIEQVLDGEFEADDHVLGLEKGDKVEEGLGYTEGLLPEDIIEELEEIRAKIISGEIEIPEELDD